MTVYTTNPVNDEDTSITDIHNNNLFYEIRTLKKRTREIKRKGVMILFKRRIEWVRRNTIKQRHVMNIWFTLRCAYFRFTW